MTIKFKTYVEADDEGEVLGNFIDELGMLNQNVETFLNDIVEIKEVEDDEKDE